MNKLKSDVNDNFNKRTIIRTKTNRFNVMFNFLKILFDFNI